MDFVTKRSPIVALIEFQRHVASRQHALTFGRKRGCNDDRRAARQSRKPKSRGLQYVGNYGRDFPAGVGSAELGYPAFRDPPQSERGDIGPLHHRHRVSDERSSGRSRRKNSCPQKYWKYGFSTQRSHKTSSDRL
jgi:hypothetical protein